MVYGSLSAITFLLLLKNEAIAQCAGRVELLPCSEGIPSTAYIQPVGQVCFPAVIQIPETNRIQETNNNQNNVAPKQSDDDEFLSLIFLLITALTGCSNNGNSCPRSNSNANSNGQINGCSSSSVQNNSPSSYFDLLSSLIPCLCNKNPSSSSGNVCDICASNNCPCTNSNQNSASKSNTGNVASSNYGCACDFCGSNSPFPNFNQFWPVCAPPLCPYPSPSSNSGCTCDVCTNSGSSSSSSSSSNPSSALTISIGSNSPTPSSGYICDSCAQNTCGSSNVGTAPTCIYVPYPIAVPMNLPGYNFNDYCDYDNGPQEINLIIQTECD